MGNCDDNGSYGTWENGLRYLMAPLSDAMWNRTLLSEREYLSNKSHNATITVSRVARKYPNLLDAVVGVACDRDYEFTRGALLCSAMLCFADKQFKYKNPSFISLAY